MIPPVWLLKDHKAILPYLQAVLNNSVIFSKLQTAISGLIAQRVGGINCYSAYRRAKFNNIKTHEEKSR